MDKTTPTPDAQRKGKIVRIMRIEIMVPNYKVFLLVTTVICCVNRVYLIHLVIIPFPLGVFTPKQNTFLPCPMRALLLSCTFSAHLLLAIKATFFHHLAVNLPAFIQGYTCII